MKLIFAIFGFFLVINLSAQPDKRLEKQVANAIREADFYYTKGGVHYQQAIPPLLFADSVYPSNPLIKYKLGTAYIGTSRPGLALDYLKQSYELDAGVHPLLNYQLGRAYHLQSKWDSAQAHYKLYLESLPVSKVWDRLKAEKRIQEVKSGKELAGEKQRIRLVNPGMPINSAHDDYAPVVNADGSLLIFTSRRPLPDDSKGDYLEKVYSAWKSEKGFSEPVLFPETINPSKQHSSNVALSVDGQKMLIYHDSRGSGDFYQTKAVGNLWTRPEKIQGDVNSDFHESSASFSYNGKILYFISERPGGSGGKDIWASELQEDGTWGAASNLGPKINTEYNEEAVFAHHDGKTLYFSSEGHNSIGGLDIFQVEKTDNGWTVPENLGLPINTPGDDAYLVMAADGKHGWYAATHEDSQGGLDIYQVIWEEEPDEEKSFVTVLSGKVLDKSNSGPLSASIEIVENKTGEVVGNFETNSSDGAFMVVLPGGGDYGIAVSSQGYLFHSEHIAVPVGNDYTEVRKNVFLQKAEKGTRLVLNNIFFDTGESTLRKESVSELNRIVSLMGENSDLVVEISGHTDNVGSSLLNQKLSEARAKAVVEYLVQNGVASDRLSSRGYGMTRPVADNETEEGRQKNRRTEFEIVDNKGSTASGIN